MKMKQVRTRYSQEFKLKAVELSYERGNVQQAGNELGVKPETLRLWRKAVKSGKLTPESASREKPKSAESMELAKIRKELYEITQERDILKKAVSIFSKSGR
jgi:transposase